MANKVDSNSTGLRFAEESEIGVLPESGVIWYPLEPNSYSDFGGQLSTVARTPINPSRQRKKGTITDLDASGGFQQDLTVNNSKRLLQGLFFADAYERATTDSVKSAAIDITAVTATQVTATAGLDAFKVGALVRLSGFGVASNNGLKEVTAAAAGAIDMAGLSAEAAPPAGAKVETVGFVLATSTLSLVGGLPQITGTDFTALGLIPGEWVFFGGDLAANQIAGNVGFARIAKDGVTDTTLTFDKTGWEPAGASGTDVYLFFGTTLKNESTCTTIKRRTFQLERTLDCTATPQSEYIVGAVANEMTLNIAQADKVTLDLNFIASDHETRTSVDGVKSGDRPVLVNMDCFNTSSDFARIALAKVTAGDPTPTPLFAYATELSLTVNNNVTASKAIGKLGAIDTAAGLLEVGGSITAYFADVAAIAAVRNNDSCTMDIIMASQNTGVAIDIPLLTLGNGRLNVALNEAITVPLEIQAAESEFGHTFCMSFFAYLPTVAEA